MPPAPDDLPRSPTGRTPQWVIDERAGVSPDLGGWRSDSPHPVRSPARVRPVWRPDLAATGALLVAAAVIAVWWVGGTPGAPWGGTAGTSVGDRAEPSSTVVALADAAHLSDEGRLLFYGARPEILGAQEFAGRCTGGADAARPAAGGAVGCYEGATGSIVVYEPADPRLHSFAVETAAHETMHVAWAHLEDDVRARLTPLLETELARLAADDPIHEQLAGSVGSHTESRATELFAYVGTQVWREGGLHPELEEVYSGFVADRPALVAVHSGWVSLLAGMHAEIEGASSALAAREAHNQQQQLQRAADASSVEVYRQLYAAKLAEVTALPAEQRKRLRLSWVWWDGTSIPMGPAEQTLATAADLLARDEAGLAEREASLAAEQGAAAAERTRVEGLVADLAGLNNQLAPAAPTT